MSRSTRLMINTVILFIGVVGTRLINFIMLPFYTDWLSVEEYGIIDIFSSVLSLAVPLCTLQVEQAVFRYMIDEYSDRHSTRSNITTAFNLVAFVGLIVLIIGIPICTMTNRTLYISYLFAIFIQSVFVLMQYITRGLGKNQAYTIASLILAVVNVVLAIVFIRFLGMGVPGYILAFILAHIVACIYLFFDSKIWQFYSIHLMSFERLKKLLDYSVPMIANNVSWWILNLSDRFVLNIFCGIDANGIYAAAGKIPGLITTVYNVFHMAWQESISKEINSDDVEIFISDIFDKLFAVISLGVIILLLLGKDLFSILINGKFSQAYQYMPILILGLWCLCMAQYLGGLYIGLKLPRELGKTSMLAAFVNIIVDLFLVKHIGIYAASLSTFVAYAFLLIYRIIDIRKYYNIRYKSKNNSVVVLLLLISTFAAYQFNLIVRICILIVSFFVLLGIYREYLVEIFHILSNMIKTSM